MEHCFMQFTNVFHFGFMSKIKQLLLSHWKERFQWTNKSNSCIIPLLITNKFCKMQRKVFLDYNKLRALIHEVVHFIAPKLFNSPLAKYVSSTDLIIKYHDLVWTKKLPRWRWQWEIDKKGMPNNDFWVGDSLKF